MKDLNHIILLARPLNIFIAISSAIIMSLIIPNADYSNLYLICLILTCYMSAANILNDIIDIESDRINKPHRILVNNDINPRILIVMIIGKYYCILLNIINYCYLLLITFLLLLCFY